MSVNIAELIETTNMIIRTLDPLQQEVVFAHFGLLDGKEVPLKEIAARLGKRESTIRGTLAKALRNLRHPSRSRRLKAFQEEKAGKSDVDILDKKALEDIQEKLNVIIENSFTFEKTAEYIANEAPELTLLTAELPRDRQHLEYFFKVFQILIMNLVLSGTIHINIPNINLNINLNINAPVTINQTINPPATAPVKEGDTTTTNIENLIMENHHTQNTYNQKNETKIADNSIRSRRRSTKQSRPKSKEKPKAVAIDPCKGEN